MDQLEQMKKTIGDLFGSQQLAVLATQQEGQPYASLVAFAATQNLKELLFATARSTRKFANLTRDSRVSLLVDSRSNRDADIHQAMAVTAIGTAEELRETDRGRYLEIYLGKHPHLEEFVKAPSFALIRVRVASYNLVSRFQKVMELHVTP
jgi:nitroimidazol reductase NimA-like FMN-containing flavoprotein (pyridoxamine 5'-phosphate oxidase superfamily)